MIIAVCCIVSQHSNAARPPIYVQTSTVMYTIATDDSMDNFHEYSIHIGMSFCEQAASIP